MRENCLNNGEMPELTNLSAAVKLKDFNKAKKSTTIRLKASTIYYFQKMSDDTGIPYQTLINMYLDDCAKNNRKINITWKNSDNQSYGSISPER